MPDGQADDPPEGESKGAPEQRSAAGKVGLGCFTAFLGCVSGGMFAILLGMFVAAFRHAPKCEGLPFCEWFSWWRVGALVGALTLPFFVLRRLGRPATGPQNSERG